MRAGASKTRKQRSSSRRGYKKEGVRFLPSISCTILQILKNPLATGFVPPTSPPPPAAAAPTRACTRAVCASVSHFVHARVRAGRASPVSRCVVRQEGTGNTHPCNSTSPAVTPATPRTRPAAPPSRSVPATYVCAHHAARQAHARACVRCGEQGVRAWGDAFSCKIARALNGAILQAVLGCTPCLHGVYPRCRFDHVTTRACSACPLFARLPVPLCSSSCTRL